MLPVIELENVSKKFKAKGTDFFAVRNVSFSVGNGDIFGLLGPNGAGKTTILNMIIGILIPDSGRIDVIGKSLAKNPRILEKMSMVSGGGDFHGNLRTCDILNFYGRIYGLDKDTRERRIKTMVNFFGLEEVFDRKAWYLSTGEKMRLAFAKALLNSPEILLLDEPTLGLDPDIAIKVREEVKKINRKFGTTMIITSHYMHEIEQMCNKIAFINKGAIVDTGSIEKVKTGQFSTYDVFITVSKIKERDFLRKNGFTINGNVLHKKLDLGENITEVLEILAKKKVEILDIETKKPTLEDYFVKILGKPRGESL